MKPSDCTGHYIIKTCVSTTLILMAVLFIAPHACAEVIRSFAVDITPNKDCSLGVEETIRMDFENAARHGIYRVIPVKYKRYGNDFTIDLKLLNVMDERSRSYKYQISQQGRDVLIRIGDPDRTLTGEHIYILHYIVRRAVNFFQDAPEVYWNATGNEWPFAMKQVSAVFHPPDGIDARDIKAACYVGRLGSITKGKIQVSNNHLIYSTSNLRPSEGLTLVAGLPKGAVEKPTFTQELLWFLNDWWPAPVVPLSVFALMFTEWRRSGRDQDSDKPIAVEWSPPKDLSPAEVGTLIDEKCDMADVISTLIDLAARGYLKIREIDNSNKFLFLSSKDYQFEMLEPSKAKQKLAPYEVVFLEALFPFGSTSGSVERLSRLKGSFYPYLDPIRRGIWKALMQKQLFRQDPNEVRNLYYLAAVVLLIAAGVAGFAGQVAWAAGLVISMIVVGFMAPAMPSKTAAGSRKLRECLSLKRFVQLAEKDRIAVLAKDDPTVFGRLLPYAMVLGVADKWADKFHDLLLKPPDWYESYDYGQPGYVFSPCGFVNDLGGAMNSMGHTFATAPASTGSGGGSDAGSGSSGLFGGFSGGGFGGGGGGSW